VIALVDYGMGNRRSVEKALEHVGARDVRITGDAAQVARAERIVIPGVGAFPRAMRNLRALGLVEVLRERAAAEVPVLGVCLGMQLLFDSSAEHEGDTGLGLLPGEVTALRANGHKLPHIGWNRVRLAAGAKLATGLGEAAAFYHVHSFACRPAVAADAVGESEYGETFTSVVERDNVAGVQFHPEKSSTDGLAMLRNWLAAPA